MENSYFDFIEQIPDNALNTCGKEEKEYDPFCDATTEKIGNTIYHVSVTCAGTEPILEIIKRFLFDDPLPQKEEDCA